MDISARGWVTGQSITVHVSDCIGEVLFYALSSVNFVTATMLVQYQN